MIFTDMCTNIWKYIAYKYFVPFYWYP